MLRTTLRLTAVVSAFLTIFMLAERTAYGLATPAPPPLELLLNPACQGLCYMGIAPGRITGTYEDVQHDIYHSGLPVSHAQVTHPSTGRVELRFNHFIHPHHPNTVYMKIDTDNARLTQISVTPADLCFTGVAATLGLPDAYYIAHSNETFIVVYTRHAFYMAFRAHQPARVSFLSLYDGNLQFSTDRYRRGTWRDVAGYLQQPCT
ncbi:MAG: hypothetical protein AAF787_12205 [Chloroflexota bacterium]